MNRITTALLAALEALLVVAIGVGVALVPLTFLWAGHFGLSIEWFVFWRGAVDVWLLGNGVDLMVHLDPAVAANLGLPGAGAAFPLTMALLGFGLLAMLLGVHTGRRAAETPHRWTGVVVAVAAYAVFTGLVTLSASAGAVRPSLIQGILLPTLIYATGVLVGAELSRSRAGADTEGVDRVRRALRDRYLALTLTTRTVLGGAVRGGAAAFAGVIGVSAVAVAALIVVNYATIIGLYEAVQAGVVGGFTITLAQLVIVPNIVIWAAAWFVGPGIAVGVGSSVSPVGTSLGPVPGLPILGALPHGSLAYGFLGLLVPVLIGFVCAVLTRQRLDRPGTPPRSALQHALTGLGMGVVAGGMLGLLAWWSAGAIGPGRLAEVGPNPLLVAALAAAEIGVAAAAGMLVGARRASR